MQCPNGHQVLVSASFCPTCGIALASAPATTTAPPAPAWQPPPGPTANASLVPVPPQQLQQYPVPTATVQQSRSMYTAAAVINWVVLGLVILGSGGLGIIAAAWFIPMTIRIHKGGKGPYKHTSLGVCTLLFCNLISGILMLSDDSGRPAEGQLPR